MVARILTACILAAVASACTAAPPASASHPVAPSLLPLGDGFSASSINTVIFRHSPVVSSRDAQYAAYYDNESHVVLARRTLPGGVWEVRRTEFTGNTRDAHNTISLGIDGAGIVHMAWDHHGNTLNYVRTTAPGSLDLTAKLPMDGQRETQVTYPEFYATPTGDLLFLYRVGVSGNGDLVLKRFHEGKWSTAAQNLVSGEGKANAYPEFCVGPDGTLHLGWVWRRTPDVATNHDICYARSADGGQTWTDSAGKKLALPITAATCEVALAVPEKSELINQTSIAADAQGHPYIATYFRAGTETVPQYRVIYHDGRKWQESQVSARTTAFSLSGGGTRRIPISRPLIVADPKAAPPRLLVVFRDAERGDKVTLAETVDLAAGKWALRDLTADGWGAWEPSYDPLRWTRDGILDVLVQKTDQLDGNDASARVLPATTVNLLEYKP